VTEAIVFVVPLPISARSNSIPFGRLMRTRCSAPRRRATDRSGRGFEYAWDHDTRSSPLDVHVEFDGLEERGMDRARHRPIDPPAALAKTSWLFVIFGESQSLFEISQTGSLAFRVLSPVSRIYFHQKWSIFIQPLVCMTLSEGG
jgi:hypothetical protein